MGRKKSNEEFFPEMSEILEGMQELMRDEDGNPLSPDHPSIHFHGSFKIY